MPTLSKMTSPPTTNPPETLLVRDVYKVGLNVWTFSVEGDRSRHFPTGTIKKVTIPDGGSETLQYEYPGEENIPVVTVQHDNNEGDITRDYRLDYVLIVEDIRSDDVIDAIADGIDALMAYARCDAHASLEVYHCPTDGVQPEEYRRGIRRRCDNAKRRAAENLRRSILSANRDGFPHDVPKDGLVHVPTVLYDKLWATIDHKVNVGANLESMIKAGTLAQHSVSQAELKSNLPQVYEEFLEFHKETIQNMGPPTIRPKERAQQTPPPTITTEVRDTQQPKNTAETNTESEDRKPAPITIADPSTQDDDNVTVIDETTEATIEHLPMTHVPEKLHPEIEPDSIPNVNELRKLYDSLQPVFAGMYDINKKDDPRAPLLTYATWIIYLVATQSNSRSKLLGKEWYTINQNSLEVFNYGMKAALAYTHRANPNAIVENTDATQGKALTYMSAAMNTLLSAGMGLLEDKVRDNFDAVVRNVTIGTMATSTVKKELATFVAGNVNDKLPESLLGWLRGGHVLAEHENRKPIPPKQKSSKLPTKTTAAASTSKAINSNKRKDVGSPTTDHNPKRSKPTIRPPPPSSPKPDTMASPTNPKVASLPTAQDAAKSPQSPKATTHLQSHKSSWTPPSALTEDFGPPGYLRVCAYLYLKTTRMTRERYEEWLNVFRAHTSIFDDVEKEIADDAAEKGLDPESPVYPVADESRLFMHPLIRVAYVGSLPKGTLQFELEHAAKFCKNMGDTVGCLTLCHQPMYGLKNKTVLAAGLEPVEESTLTFPYHHKEAIRKDLEALRTIWNKKQSAK